MRQVIQKMGHKTGPQKIRQAARPVLRQAVLRFLRAAYRNAIRPVLRFVYWCVAKLFAELSVLTRVAAVLAPDFFLLYQGDVWAPASLTPEFQAVRMLMAISMSFFFAVYFFWDTLVVAGRHSKKSPHMTGQDWDRAKAAMDDADPSMMGTSAWIQRRTQQVQEGKLPRADKPQPGL